MFPVCCIKNVTMQQVMDWMHHRILAADHEVAYLSFFKGVFSPCRSTYHIGSLITADTFTWQYAPESAQISNAPAEELGCS